MTTDSCPRNAIASKWRTLSNRPDIAELIDDERVRQGLLWDRPHEWGVGDCSAVSVPDVVKLAVLMEEVGEVARAVLEKWDDTELVAELVQVNAVSAAWLEALI